MNAIELSPILIEASLRGIVLLALTGIATWALRRRSGALRHALWLVALSGLLVAPLASAFLPAIPLPILPQRSDEKAMTTVVSRSAETGNATATQPEAGMQGGFESLSKPSAARPRKGMPWVAIWLVGCLWMLARVIQAQRQVAALVRAATPIRDSILVAHYRAALAASGAPPHTECRISSRVDVPLACGIFHRVVLLPARAGEWSAADLRSVLAHELAHLRRRDPLMLALAQVVRAIHWFHPLVWWAVRELRAESERACDDAVIRGGEQPSRYAETLLAFAGAATPEPALALAFLRRGGLEGRITGILEPNRDRKPLGRAAHGWIGVMGLLAVLGLALFRPVEVGASRAPTPRPKLSAFENESVAEAWLSRARSVEPSVARFRNRIESPVRIRYAEIRIVPNAASDAVGMTMAELMLENRDPMRRVVGVLLAFDLPTTRDRSWIDVSIAPTGSARLRVGARHWSAVVPEDEAEQLTLHVVGVRFAHGEGWRLSERSPGLPSPGTPAPPEAGFDPEADFPTPEAWAPGFPAPRDAGTTPRPTRAPEPRWSGSTRTPAPEWTPAPESAPEAVAPELESAPEGESAPRAEWTPAPSAWAPWSPASQPDPWDQRPDPRPDARPDPRPDPRPDVRPDPRPNPRPDASGWVPARVRNPNDAPVVILEARTPRHANIRGEKALTWLPEVVIENRSAKRVVGLRLRYKAEREGHGVSGYRVAIEPHGTAIVHRKDYEIWGRAENMTVQILGVSFEDGSVWGTLDSTIDARDPWVYPLSPEER